MTTTNIWCFMVKEVNIAIWERLLNQICVRDKTNKEMNYILISLKEHNKVIMGYTECSLAIHTLQTYLVNIIGLYNIHTWKEVTNFRHLSLCHTMIRSIVLHDAQLYYEHGYPTSTMNNIMVECNNLLPLINNNDIVKLFEKSKHEMALIIEQTKTDTPISFGKALEAKEKKMLSFTMENLVDTVHIIYPATNQCYHAFNFHQNPHYGIEVQHIPLIKWIMKNSNINYTEYVAEQKYHHTNFLTIHNNYFEGQFPFQHIYRVLKGYKLRSRNLSNYFISYGYSSMYRGKNGEPLLTKAIETKAGKREKLLPLLLPILCNLSRDIKLHYQYIAGDLERNKKYCQKLGCNFNYCIPNMNIFEGFDVSLMYSDSFITPHCDVMNDWRYGYNYISVVKNTFWDDNISKSVTLSIICYTRKAVGDELYGGGKQNAK